MPISSCASLSAVSRYVSVAGVDHSSGERDLPLVVLDLLGALLEDDAEVAVGFIQGQQDGGGYERVAVYGDR